MDGESKLIMTAERKNITVTTKHVGSTIKRSNVFITPIWVETSKQVLLQNDYICAMCGGEATMTDHIISVKKDWSKRLDWDNLQPSCKACNDAKAVRERTGN